jgi:Flp pilus assembly protein TadB
LSRRSNGDIVQAGLTMTVGTLLLAAGCLAILTYIAVKFFTFSTLLALGRRDARGVRSRSSTVKQMKSRASGNSKSSSLKPIDLIGRAIRAGHAFTTGLTMVADEIPKPVGEEFKLLYDRQNYGMPLPEAMKAFASRIPLIDARFFVTAVLTQRETGGNLGEVLDNLASVIRDRFRRQTPGPRPDGARPDHGLDSRRHAARARDRDDVRRPQSHEDADQRSPRGSDDRWRPDASGDRHVDHPEAGRHPVLRNE